MIGIILKQSRYLDTKCSQLEYNSPSVSENNRKMTTGVRSVLLMRSFCTLQLVWHMRRTNHTPSSLFAPEK